MGTTPTYSWPYPESTDPVANGAQDIEDLALAVETTVSGLPGGKILQVLSTTKTDTFSSALSAGGSADITGLAVTITPSSATSTILLYGSVHGSNSTGPANNVAWFFQRGSTAIGIGDAASTRSRITAAQYGAGFAGLGIGNASMLIEDSPATTSATTYKITLFAMSAGTLYVNRTGTDTDSSQYPRTVSSIIALEVSA
jgi:hypothetical protein